MNMEVTYINGLLAEASYADLENINVQDDLINALVASGFSETQAILFADHWRVVPNSHQPDTEAGFSATVFRSLDNPDKYVIGIRGTNGIVDLLSADFWNLALY